MHFLGDKSAQKTPIKESKWGWSMRSNYIGGLHKHMIQN